MRDSSLFSKLRNMMAVGVVSMPLALAPVVAQAQLATVVLNQIAAAMSTPGGDLELLAQIVSADPDSAAEIASTAVKLRPDLAGQIASSAAEANPEQMLKIAEEMARACPSCAQAIALSLSSDVPTQALAIQIAVSNGSGSELENPSEGNETDEENESTDVASPSSA